MFISLLYQELSSLICNIVAINFNDSHKRLLNPIKINAEFSCTSCKSGQCCKTGLFLSWAIRLALTMRSPSLKKSRKSAWQNMHMPHFFFWFIIRHAYPIHTINGVLQLKTSIGFFYFLSSLLSGRFLYCSHID